MLTYHVLGTLDWTSRALRRRRPGVNGNEKQGLDVQFLL